MQTLQQILRDTPGLEGRALWGAHGRVAMDAIVKGGCLDGEAATLSGQSVLVDTSDQLSAAMALIELHGVAGRLILCPPDLATEHLPTVVRDGEVTAVVTDRAETPAALAGLRCVRIAGPSARPNPSGTAAVAIPTEWAMFTSGTTGPPKMVIHDLPGLTGAIKPMAETAGPVVWATFYDIRRYGGLQILFRGLLSGGSMVISGADESMADLLSRMGQAGVTHVSGTPSHWRKALSIGAPKLIAPAYVRLSGEIADQMILNQLTAAFPDASVGHAYASTEAGVGFEVNDGLEGVPANLLEGRTGEVEIKVVDGSLRIRSNRTAKRYVGASGVALADADGFVDTGDMVELRDNRYYFKGRRGGIINVGGLKVHPEEIEGVINSYPGVRVSLAYGRRNPLTGFIVVAEVVLEDDQAATGTKIDEVKIRGDILRFCHDRLAAFKVPALLRFVPTLRMTEGGKLLRERA